MNFFSSFFAQRFAYRSIKDDNKITKSKVIQLRPYLRSNLRLKIHLKKEWNIYGMWLTYLATFSVAPYPFFSVSVSRLDRTRLPSFETLPSEQTTFYPWFETYPRSLTPNPPIRPEQKIKKKEWRKNEGLIKYKRQYREESVVNKNDEVSSRPRSSEKKIVILLER